MGTRPIRFDKLSRLSEYSIYEYIPKESIISVLESLQIDLICAGLFNDDYFLLNSHQQLLELNRLKELILKHVKEENNPYMLYVFDELYLKKRNISEIAKTPLEEEKLVLMRNKILTKSQRLNSPLIKRKLS